ncbi:MAG: hypothetical protein AB8D78_04060 [Akkermansiaceae bacterium]
MKTTLDLPEDLLIDAKAVAARRRTTLKEMVTHALHREIAPAADIRPEDTERYETGSFGIMRLKKRGAQISDQLIAEITEQGDQEEFDNAMKIRSAK